MTELNPKASVAIFKSAQALQATLPKRGKPPEEGLPAQTEQVIASSIVRGSRRYIERIVEQINGCYENGWFDAAAVMVRRLLETLIIELFEKKGLASAIKNASGDFLYLSELIDRTVNEPSWNLGRNARKALPRLKDVGDRSAHSRRFIAHRDDIDRLMPLLRDVVQELVHLAELK